MHPRGPCSIIGTRSAGTARRPSAADIDPAAIRHALGDTFMLAADFVDQLRFRLAGTRVCALFCREIKGEAFAALWSENSRKSIDDLLAIVTDERRARSPASPGAPTTAPKSIWNSCCCRSPISGTPASARSACWRR